MTHKALSIAVAATALLMSACGSKSGSTSEAASSDGENAETVSVPAFSADSAYAYVARQTQAGPRVPGSAAHAATADWLEAQLRAFGADTVIVQRATMADAEGKQLPVRNILAKYNPDATNRLLLLAHYDSRPWADEDPDPANHSKPIDGANDGASGVGVLLEVARQLGLQNPGTGVDILFTDTEDSGLSAPEGADAATQERYDRSWCLGTQHFVRNLPYDAAHVPTAAVLLDMVGGKDAVFPQEYFSAQAAPALLQRVADAAAEAGHSGRFPATLGGAVNDDHVPLIQAGIPAVDIIEIGHPQTGSFNPTWHTLQDNLQNIDPATLGAVGETVLTLIYRK